MLRSGDVCRLDKFPNRCPPVCITIITNINIIAADFFIFKDYPYFALIIMNKHKLVKHLYSPEPYPLVYRL